MLLFANCQILFGFQVFSMKALPCVIESRRLHRYNPLSVKHNHIKFSPPSPHKKQLLSRSLPACALPSRRSFLSSGSVSSSLLKDPPSSVLPSSLSILQAPLYRPNRPYRDPWARPPFSADFCWMSVNPSFDNVLVSTATSLYPLFEIYFFHP